MLLCLLANLGYAGGDGSVTEVELPRREAVPGGGFSVSNLRDKWEAWRKKKQLEEQLAREQAKLRKIEKSLDKVEAKAEVINPPAGILSSLYTLQAEERKVEAKIQSLQLKIEDVDFAIQILASRSDVDDDDDMEALML